MLCVERWLVANRGVTPSDAPSCNARADASRRGEVRSRDGSVSSWRRHAAIYSPTLPRRSKLLSKPSSVLPSSSNTFKWLRPSSSNRCLMSSPPDCTSALFAWVQYTPSSSVFISTKLVRIQRSKEATFDVMPMFFCQRPEVSFTILRKRPELHSI